MYTVIYIYNYNLNRLINNKQDIIIMKVIMTRAYSRSAGNGVRNKDS